MANLNMGNVKYALTDENIDAKVKNDAIGNYGLGYIKDGKFCVAYVGRSDTDLNRRLHDHVEENAKYKYFKFSYARTPKEAYEKECINFHDFGGTKSLENERHPDRPEGKGDYKCPVCGREYILQ